ncbi:uncharacterized protein LOC131598139 [Vicia villosa]|uniref:uncharacterized protein LOC131598139 n=1 Tax=Vicia villosa TaxID=3911 RepID=UPI00273B923E|nr:uncharacterized protein LOC131598139 [Vicia villosa]
MEERYGRLVDRILFKSIKGSKSLESLWWRDIMKIGDDNDDAGFIQNLAIKLGDGGCVPFWTKRWLGSRPFCLLFPLLFQVLEGNEVSMQSMGRWENNRWVWNLAEMEVELSLEASVELEELKEIPLGIEPRKNEHDNFVWPLNEDGVFNVSSCYKKLMQGRADRVAEPRRMGARSLEAAQILWELRMPSKVKIFGWRLIQDRLATKSQLIKRGILEQNDAACCVFGCSQIEDIQHLFINCAVLRRLWGSIYDWLGIAYPVGSDCISNFLHMLNSLRFKCSRKRVGCIWMATCWLIWKQRNDIIFNNVVADMDEILHSVKMLSWWWLEIGNNRKVLCNFYEWSHCPLEYM